MVVARRLGSLPALLVAAWAISEGLAVRAEGPSRGVGVTGRVLDVGGRPIAGARVSWSTDLPNQGTSRDTATDADGRFALEGVTDDPIVLTAEAAGHSPELKTIPARAGREPVEFRLGPGHTIRGRILDAQGLPIADAPIAVQDWRGHQSLKWSTRTDAEGRFRWDGAPPDRVSIDLGKLGFEGERAWQTGPDQPEETIPVRRPLRVRGRVADAETGRPIRPFRLVPGRTDHGSPFTWWDDDAEVAVSGLSYDVSLSTEMPIRVIRIEAPGYEPAVSRPIRDAEKDAVVHMRLRRGRGLSGVVRLADGSPMAGAEVMASTERRLILLQNGRTVKSIADQWITRTGADGRFDLPEQEPPFTILVLDDRGYVEERFQARPSKPVELTARPWGRIEGTLRIGGRVGAGQSLALELRSDDRARPPGNIGWNSYAQADDDGKFLFDRVPSGSFRISRHLAFGDAYSSGVAPVADLEIRPGTIQLALGGTGRAVVGKVVVPDEVARRGDWYIGPGTLARRPIDPRRWEPILFKIEPGGTFRIDDLAAGTYELQAQASERPERGPRIGGKTLASIRRDVVVPPVARDGDRRPIDLGAIRLELQESGSSSTQQGPKR